MTITSNITSGFVVKATPLLPLVVQFGEHYKKDNLNAKITDPHYEITYEVLRSDDAEQAAALIAHNFCSGNRGEPTSVRRNIHEDELKKYVFICGAMGAAEKLSLVVRNKHQEIIGAIISFDFTSPIPFPDAVLEKKFAPLLKMIEILDSYVPQLGVNNRYLHQFLVAVDRRYAGKNILLLMLLLNNEMGRIRGFQEAVAEPTGPISQNAFLKALYRRVAGLAYDDFYHEGVIPFEKLHETFSAQTHKDFLRAEHRLVELMLVMKPIHIPLAVELKKCN